MKETPYQWFAMRATYKREMAAKEYLEGKGIEVFVPMKREVKVIRGIKRKVKVPAINSLIFVYAQKEALQQAKYGVEYLQYLTRKLDGKNIPIIVPYSQMEQFRKVVEDDAVDKKFFADHHSYTSEDLKLIHTKLKNHPRAIVLMTEKDAVKLRRATRIPESLRRAMYYQPIDINFIDGPDRDFIGNLIADIEHKEEEKGNKAEKNIDNI